MKHLGIRRRLPFTRLCYRTSEINESSTYAKDFGFSSVDLKP